MKIAAIAISTGLLGLASVTPASALPVSAIGHGTVQSNGITLVAQKVVKKRVVKRNGVKKVVKKKVVKRNGTKRVVKKVKYRAGGRYSKAPRGWHRHNKRPSYWRTRNCITVGPLWYCP